MRQFKEIVTLYTITPVIKLNKDSYVYDIICLQYVNTKPTFFLSHKMIKKIITNNLESHCTQPFKCLKKYLPSTAIRLKK